MHTIDRRAILAFRTALARRPGRGSNRKLSAQRINHVMIVLTMVLTEACKQFGLTHYLAHDIPRLRVQRPDVHPFSLNEARQLLAAVRADYHDYYVVRFFTGLRTGEIDGLQWRYVDFDSNEILVREAVVRNRLETPKTSGSMRDVESTTSISSSPPFSNRPCEQDRTQLVATTPQ